MGSIAAVLFRTTEHDEAPVRAMLDAAPHRGSDSKVARIGRAVLAISDHADRREGSIAAADGMAAAFTGSLDNAAELARELGNGGSLDPDDPAAILIAAFRRF